jgi:hypothetical protein
MVLLSDNSHREVCRCIRVVAKCRSVTGTRKQSPWCLGRATLWLEDINAGTRLLQVMQEPGFCRWRIGRKADYLDLWKENVSKSGVSGCQIPDIQAGIGVWQKICLARAGPLRNVRNCHICQYPVPWYWQMLESVLLIHSKRGWWEVHL